MYGCTLRCGGVVHWCVCMCGLPCGKGDWQHPCTNRATFAHSVVVQVYEASAEDLVQFAGSLGESIAVAAYVGLHGTVRLSWCPAGVGKESGTQNSSGVCVLRLQGLPYRATQQEIVRTATPFLVRQIRLNFPF